MTIDTKEETTTTWRAQTYMIAIFVAIVILITFFLPVAPEFRILICGVLSVLFLIFWWFQQKMEYTYFYFSNNGDNLVFRFYRLRSFIRKPKTVEISKKNFVKYDIVTSFFNKKDMLILYQKTPKGVAKYPPISLTLLTAKQKTELKRALFSIRN